ncbi:MAG: YggT family protein [SAR202 cluster bacterium]|jgi:YggT family protein|nr:YggT family protein [SAR202 cluster bacterium]
MDFIVRIVDTVAAVLWIAFLGRVILSWINVTPSSPLYPIVTILYQITEPILAPIRRVMPRMGMLDLSPMVALILISLIQRIIRGALV